MLEDVTGQPFADLMQALVLDKLDMANSFFRAYVSRLEAEDRALFEDVSLIASEDELAEFVQVSGEADRVAPEVASGSGCRAGPAGPEIRWG